MNPIPLLIKILLFSIIFIGCYSNIPPEACSDLEPHEINAYNLEKAEFRVERDMSQRVMHSWYEILDSNQNYVKSGPEKLYFINGNKKSQITWHMGSKEGLFEIFHPNGHLSARGYFSNSQFDKEVKSWSESGILLSIKTWNKGKLEGLQEKRNEKGELLERYFLKEGVKADLGSESP